jgi:hypothetical protein
MRDDFGEELHGLDGRGYAFHRSGGACASCASTLVDASYRCRDCMYDDMVCRSCMFDHHGALPLHAIEVRSYSPAHDSVN